MTTQPEHAKSEVPSSSNPYPDIAARLESVTKHRMACPLCRESGKDSTGDHLSVGRRWITCYADDRHGEAIWNTIRQTSPSSHASHRQRPPLPPKKYPGHDLVASPLPDHLLNEPLPAASIYDPNGAFFIQNGGKHV